MTKPLNRSSPKLACMITSCTLASMQNFIVLQITSRASVPHMYDFLWERHTWLNMRNTLSDALNNAAALVTKNDWKQALWVTATQCVRIRVADTRVQNLHSHNRTNTY